MSETDIRWKQRFANYKKAYFQLEKFISRGELNELEEQGLIKAFEYTFELAWNLLKDYYFYQGETNIQGSRDAFRLAVSRELISSESTWMEMIISRNNTTHIYNEEIASEIADAVRKSYFPLFKQLFITFNKIETAE
jgi:nucleotidyltransferase substrate binding protein (TIGR01987 family)